MIMLIIGGIIGLMIGVPIGFVLLAILTNNKLTEQGSEISNYYEELTQLSEKSAIQEQSQQPSR